MQGKALRSSAMHCADHLYPKKSKAEEVEASLKALSIPDGNGSLLVRLLNSHQNDGPGSGRRAADAKPSLADIVQTNLNDSMDSKQSQPSSTPSPKQLSPLDKKGRGFDHKHLLDLAPPPRSQLHGLHPLSKSGLSPRHSDDDKPEEQSFGNESDSSHDLDSALLKRSVFPNSRLMTDTIAPSKPLGKGHLAPLPDLKKAARPEPEVKEVDSSFEESMSSPAPAAAAPIGGKHAQQSAEHEGSDIEEVAEEMEESIAEDEEEVSQLDAAIPITQAAAESVPRSASIQPLHNTQFAPSSPMSEQEEKHASDDESEHGPEHDSSDSDHHSDHGQGQRQGRGFISGGPIGSQDSRPTDRSRTTVVKELADSKDVSSAAAETKSSRASVQRLGQQTTRSAHGWDNSDTRDEEEFIDRSDEKPRSGGLLASLRMRARPASASPEQEISQVDDSFEDSRNDLQTSQTSYRSNQDDEEDDAKDAHVQEDEEDYEEDYASEDELIIQHDDHDHTDSPPAKPSASIGNRAQAFAQAKEEPERIFSSSRAPAPVSQKANNSMLSEDADYGEDFEDDDGPALPQHRKVVDEEQEEEEEEEIADEIEQDMSVGEESESDGDDTWGKKKPAAESAGIFRQRSGMLPAAQPNKGRSYAAADTVDDFEDDEDDGGFNPSAYLATASTSSKSNPVPAVSKPRSFMDNSDEEDAIDTPKVMPKRIATEPLRASVQSDVIPLDDDSAENSIASEEFSAGDGDSAEDTIDML